MTLHTVAGERARDSVYINMTTRYEFWMMVLLLEKICYDGFELCSEPEVAKCGSVPTQTVNTLKTLS